jgi:hypothetical protein
MASEMFVYDKSFTSVSDLSTLQFYIVSSSAAGNVDLCVASSGATGVVRRPYGVLQNAPTSGKAAIVRRGGTSKCVASSSGTISVGAFVACSTAGNAMAATTGMWVVGTAMTASTGAAGQLIELDMAYQFSYQAAGATA